MSGSSGLCQFIVGRYDDWAKDRKDILDGQMNTALKLFKGEDISKWKFEEAEDWRSSTVIKWVKVKVFSAYSVLCDVLFQGGKIPFNLIDSPFNKRELDEEGQKLNETSREQMQDKIQEQNADRKADREYMRKIMAMSIYGLAWSKYNIVDVDREYYDQVSYGSAQRFQQASTTEKVPGWEYRSPFSIVWDMDNEDIQKGGGVIEQESLSAYDLRQKKGQHGYIDANIDHILAEHDKDSKIDEDGNSLPPGKRLLNKHRANIKTLEAWILAPRALVESFEKDVENKVEPDNYSTDIEHEDQGDDVEIMAVVAKSTSKEEIIKFIRHEPNKRPYRLAVWEQLVDETTGHGIPESMKDLSTTYNGLIRSIEDNTKLSGNVERAVKKSFFKPGQLDTPHKPGKQYDVDESVDDVRKALMPIITPDVTQGSVQVLSIVHELIDIMPQIPSILHGGTEKDGKKTAFETSQLIEMAGKYLGSVIRNIDEQFIEPETKWVYDYNMADPEYPGQKGNWVVHPNGFTSFQNKVVKIQKLKELLGMIVSNENLMSEAKIRPHLDEIYKGSDLDPEVFLKSEEEKAEEQQQQAMMREQAKKEMLEQEQAKVSADAAVKSKLAEEEFHRKMLEKGLDQVSTA